MCMTVELIYNVHVYCKIKQLLELHDCSSIIILSFTDISILPPRHMPILHVLPVIGFRRRDPDEDGDDVRFPEGLDDLTNTSFDSIPAEITLPPALFRERRRPGSESLTDLSLLYTTVMYQVFNSPIIHAERSASISSVIFQNMEAALPDRWVHNNCNSQCFYAECLCSCHYKPLAYTRVLYGMQGENCTCNLQVYVLLL